jgi:hypothetical protein
LLYILDFSGFLLLFYLLHYSVSCVFNCYVY